MGEIAQALADSTARLFEQQPAGAEWSGAAWSAVEELGLPLVLVPEDAGGFGVPPADALALIRLIGRYAAPVSIAETIVANALLARAGLPLADRPTALKAASEAVGEDDLLVAGALTRALLMAGALERVLELTIDHVSTRVQFGRPLAKFQAIQQAIAQLAGEVAAASAAADHAADAWDTGDLRLAVAVARARIGEAAGKATAIAQQLHGAIGFTREHALHRFTTALWAWRDEYGTQGFWTREVGRSALAAGRGGFWPMVAAA